MVGNCSVPAPAPEPRPPAEPELGECLCPALPDQRVDLLGPRGVQELLHVRLADRRRLEPLLDALHEEGEHHQQQGDQQDQEDHHGAVIIPHSPRPGDQGGAPRVAAGSDQKPPQGTGNPLPPETSDGSVGSVWQPGSVVKKARIPATPLARTRRARQLSNRLADGYPDAHCELDFSTPLELVVATILSAQSTDVRVNMTTPPLFARFRTAQ